MTKKNGFLGQGKRPRKAAKGVVRRVRWWDREEAMDRITFIDRQPVLEEHRHWAAKLHRLFVGRLYDQIQARRS